MEVNVRVDTPEQREQVQLTVFDMGGEWNSGSTEVKFKHDSNTRYITIENQGYRGNVMMRGSIPDNRYAQIAFEEFMDRYAPDTEGLFAPQNNKI